MKRWIAWSIWIVMLFSIAGCQSAETEDGAAVGEYIEGEEQQLSGDAPEKVTDWETVLPSEDEETAKEDPVVEELPEEQPEEKGEEEQENQPEEQPEETPDQPEADEEVEEEPEPKPIVTPQSNTLKIVSYNVRCKSDGAGKKISERSERFKKVMEQYDPDIMGLQEVVPEWLDYLERDFKADYEYINRWRAESSEESTPIFWKRERFTLLESGHFWLSDTPEAESIATEWGAEYYRICMWVKLKIKATGKTVLFLNTHLDTAKVSRVPAAELILKRTESMGGFSKYPCLITGDFNMRSSQEAYDVMCSKFKDINVELENDKTPTNNGYHKEDYDARIIDYCFIAPDRIRPLKYKVIDEYIDDGYVSDHCGLYIEAEAL